jgi:inorganic triphosphatase YgiF
MPELELKFQVPAGRRDALLRALGRRRRERVPMLARYFDTADGLLGRHGLALRLRREGDAWVQALKGRGAHAAERLEHEVTLGPRAAAPDPRRHAGTEVGDRLLALLHRHDDPPLAERWRTDVARTRARLRAPGSEVEWALDEGEVAVGAARRPIAELELEHLDGDPARLYALAIEWQAGHGLWLDVVSKAERGELLASGRPFLPPVKAAAPSWTRREARALRGAGLLRAMVGACLAQALPNASELAGGSRDPEHVHQLRVALRRLRSVARLSREAEALPAGWEPPVRAVFAALGVVRDAHVLEVELLPRLRDAGAPATPPPPEPAGDGTGDPHAALQSLVRGAPFQSTLLRLMAFAHGAHEDADDAAAVHDRPPLAALRRRLTRLLRRVLRDADRFPALPLAERHRVRKRLKRLRYGAEMLAPLHDAGEVAAWSRVLRKAQDALGAHVDLALAAQRFERAAAGEPRHWFAVGWLRARSDATARAGRKALRRLREAEPFW